jgi:nitrous oxidase accessory protein NosD
MRRSSHWFLAFGYLVVCLSSTTRAAEPIAVIAGESVQAAIDKAPDGATIVLAPGEFAEGLVISKPITLRGAGWDKTTVGSGKKMPLTQRQKDEFFAALEAATSQEQRVDIAVAFATRQARPTVTVKDAKDVVLRGIRFRAPNAGNPDDRLTADTMVTFENASGTMSECAVIGPFMNGIAVLAGSDVKVEKSLVAAMWGTGVAVARDGKLRLYESDVRNCYHRCVTIAADDATVERCRISGSAWHGVRYDRCSPTVQHNVIYGNARFGIYAAGGTKAVVHGNILARNEMSGMICWDDNQDSVEGNTVVDNVGEGVVVNGQAKPTLLKNIIAGSPTGVWCGQAQGRDKQPIGPGEPALERNVFWRNEKDLGVMKEARPLPPGNTVLDPKFVAPEKRDYALAADSQARKTGAGVADPIPIVSPFPIQPEERAIIPDSDTRDYSKWKKAPAQ